MSSLLERFKRKRASLDSEGISTIAKASYEMAFSSPEPPPHGFRNQLPPHHAKIHNIHHPGVRELGTQKTFLQLRADDLLRGMPQRRSSDIVRHHPLRSSLPTIAALDDVFSKYDDDPPRLAAVTHADSQPTLGSADNLAEEDDPGESACLSAEMPVPNGGSTTDEYRTLSSDDETYVSCRTFNRGSSSTLGNWSPACFETGGGAIELGTLEETNDDESSTATTPVSQKEVPKHTDHKNHVSRADVFPDDVSRGCTTSGDELSMEERHRIQREHFLRQLEEAESVDV